MAIQTNISYKTIHNVLNAYDNRICVSYEALSDFIKLENNPETFIKDYIIKDILELLSDILTDEEYGLYLEYLNLNQNKLLSVSVLAKSII